jgi:ATP-binding cassette, subfamily B, bacterial
MPSRPLRVLWSAMAGVRPVFALALVCIVLAALASLVDPLVLRFTLDSVLAGKAPELPPPLDSILSAIGGASFLARNLWLCALALLAASCFNALFSFLRGALSAVAAEATTKNLRDRLAAHVDALPASYFGTMVSGDLIQRATSDMDTVRRFLATQVEEVGRAVALLSLTVVMMAGLDGPMTLASVPVIPAVFAFSYFFFRKIQRAFTRSDEAEAALTQVLEENLHGIRVVRAFAREDFEIERFDARNRRYTGVTRELIVLFGWYWGISVLLCAAQEVATIGFGAGRVASGGLSAGSYLAFIAYVGRVLWPVRQLGRTLTEVGKAMVSLGRITQVLNVPDEYAGDCAARESAEAEASASVPAAKLGSATGCALSGASPAPAAPGGRGRVEFRKLCVEHEKGKPVLRDLSFTIEGGETVALLGKTGSGKSTLAAALVRLVEPSSGSILLDGEDIRLMDRRVLRERIGLVLQEPYLFSRSLRENVELGTGELGEEELERASRLALLSPVVASFKEGWGTAVGEEGVTLSGGQRRRLALARTLAKRPQVLVLDDTLSALDAETDSLVRRELAGESSPEAKAAGRAPTIIIVAHRIATLMGADRIVVLEDGRVADIGTHDELVARPGLYSRIWELQRKGSWKKK